MNEEHQDGALIRELANAFERYQSAHVLANDGATAVQCNILCELLRFEGINQKALADRLGLDKGWISRAIEPLVRDGSISKSPSELDRRGVQLTLTRSGRVRARRIERSLVEHAGRCLEALSNDQTEVIRQSLMLLLTAIHDSF